MGDLEAAEAVTLRALQIALETGLETVFRVSLRNLARVAAGRGRFGDAAVLLAASHRNMPVFGVDPAFYRPLEEQCRDAIGRNRFEQLTTLGEAMSHQELMTFVGADEATGSRLSATRDERSLRP
ncbi:MAG: hypothetical protein ACXVQY_11620 [Actinomycetota bacterium]